MIVLIRTTIGISACLAGWEKYRLDQKVGQTAVKNNNKEVRRERDKSCNNRGQKSLAVEKSFAKTFRHRKVRDRKRILDIPVPEAKLNNNA